METPGRNIQKKSKPLSSQKKQALVGLVYISPFYVLFMIFGLYPILSGFYLSFFRWDGVSVMRFLGPQNYFHVLTDPLFQKALSNTLIIGIIGHIPILLGGVVLAYILNSKLISSKHIKNIFKTIYFMPMVTSSVAVSLVFQNLFGNNYGIINAALTFLGGSKINWLGNNGSLIKIAVIVMFSWKWIGWNMVIYLAGMQGINEDIYEAAIIDGASNPQIFLRITIPLLRPIILFTVVSSCIGMFNLFTEPFILTGGSDGAGWQGGQNNGGLTLMIYLLGKAPQGGNAYGYAASVAYIITLIIVALTVIINRLLGERELKSKGEKP
jgi:ABC-type sugar transport system permease subunit